MYIQCGVRTSAAQHSSLCIIIFLTLLLLLLLLFFSLLSVLLVVISVVIRRVSGSFCFVVRLDGRFLWLLFCVSNSLGTRWCLVNAHNHTVTEITLNFHFELYFNWLWHDRWAAKRFFLDAILWVIVFWRVHYTKFKSVASTHTHRHFKGQNRPVDVYFEGKNPLIWFQFKLNG